MRFLETLNKLTLKNHLVLHAFTSEEAWKIIHPILEYMMNIVSQEIFHFCKIISSYSIYCFLWLSYFCSLRHIMNQTPLKIYLVFPCLKYCVRFWFKSIIKSLNRICYERLKILFSNSFEYWSLKNIYCRYIRFPYTTYYYL